MNLDQMFKTRRWLSDEAEAIINDPEKMKVARAVMMFLQTYFPEHFPSAHPVVHEEMIAIAMFASNSALAIPRGHSKSTLLTFGLAMWYIVTMEYRYILIASESYDKAEGFVTRIRDELEFNTKLIRDFAQNGKFKTTDWAKGEIVTDTRVKVQAIGYGQSGRGMVFEATRPDLVLYDDLETTENAGDQKMKDKFLTDLFPAIAKANPKKKRIYVGTIINKESLLYESICDTDMWVSARYECITDENRMLAPMLYPAEDYKKEYASYRRKGKLSLFYAEMHSNPNITDGESTFRQEHFQYYDELPDNLRYHIFYDPAMPVSGRTRSKRVDRSAIIVLATDALKRWYLVDIHANRDVPSKNRQLLYSLQEKYNAKIWMETIAAQRGMYLEIKEEAKRIGKSVKIEEIPSHSGSKEARIEQLQPLYEMGMIFHNRSDKNTALLEEELMLFGNTLHDDISDCLSFAIGRVSYPKAQSTIRQKKVRDYYDNFFKDQSTSTSWRVV